MALAETAKLAVQLSLTGNFAKQIGTASKSLDKFGAKLDHTESRAFRAGQQIGTGIKRGAAIAAVGVGIIAANVVQGLDSLVELEKQTTQTNAALKSTGRAAGLTAADIRRLAEKYEGLNATVGDEVIQSAENLLLSFTNIRKKAFEPTLKAALDVNTRLGRGPEGLAGTLRIVAKAVNDPIKGLGGLSRLGIKLNDSQVKQIGTLLRLTKAERKRYGLLKLSNPKLAEQYKQQVLAGRAGKAQAIVLKELEKRFGGAFGAEGQTTAGKVAKFKDSIEDLQRTLAAGLLPVVSNIADALTELFQDEGVKKGVEDFGKSLGEFLSPEKIRSGIGAIKDVFSTIAAVAGPAASAVGAMVSAFAKLPPDLRNLLVGAFAVNKLTGGLVTNVAGGLIGALKNLVVPVQNVQAGVVNIAGGVPGAGAPGAAGAAAAGGGSVLKTVLGTALKGLGVILAAQIADEIHEAIKPPSTATSDLSWPWGPKNTPKIAPNLGIPGLIKLTGPNGILGGTPANAPSGKPADHFGAADQQKKLAAIQLEVQRKGEQTAGKLDTTKTAIDQTKTKVGTTGTAIQSATRSSVLSGTNHVASTVASGSGAIVAAIWAARPQINVTNVTKSYNNTIRYGATSGSQGLNNGHAGNSGPLP